MNPRAKRGQAALGEKKRTGTFFALANAEALAKLLIEKGIITKEEFTQKLSDERAVYQAMLRKMG